MSSTGLYYLQNLDGEILLLVQRILSHPLLDSFFLFITDLHKQKIFLIFFALPLLLWWAWREKLKGIYKIAWLTLTILFIDGFCGSLVKKAIARPRPFILFPEVIQKSPASGFSFVSNHAANMAGLAFFLSHYYPRWKFFWWFLAFLVAFSRVYNGVHFVSDVVVGSLIGILISWGMTRWLDRRLARINLKEKK